MRASAPETHLSPSSGPEAATTAARSGARAVLPLLAGIAPLGLTVGAVGAASGLHPVAAWSSTLLVYGGTNQVVAIELLDAGATASLVVMASLVVSIPRLAFAAAMAPHWRDTSWGWRLGASYLLVDPVFLVAAPHHERTSDRSAQRAFFAGAGLALLGGWVVATAAGATIAGRVPGHVGLQLGLPLLMIGFVGRTARSRPALVAALVAATAAIVARDLPYRTGFVLAAVIGVGTGVLVDRRRPCTP